MLNESIEKEKRFTIFKNIINLYSNNGGIKIKSLERVWRKRRGDFIAKISKDS